MSEKAKLIAEIEGVIRQELALLGIRKNKLIYTCVLAQDMSGWIGLNTMKNRSDGTVGINPIIGIRSEQIESMVDKLSGIDATRPSPTISTSIGYLMKEGEFVKWLFDPNPKFDYVTEAKKVAKAIELYGIPFMKENASLEALLDHLEHLRFTYKESAVYRLPVAYMLTNRTDQALNYVHQQIEALEGKQDDYSLRYKTFGKALLQQLQGSA